jgi:AcrR family transcriptional regulator
VAPRKSASTKSPARARRARGSLSHEEILRAARQVIETDGLQELSYPRLADQLNAGAASLYWYFHTKDELLAAVVDDVTREMYLRLAPVGDGPWDEEIVEYHVRFRALLNSSDVYREVFAFRAQTLFLRSRMAPVILRALEDDLALFVRAGLTPDEAAHAFNAFSVFTRAFVVVEHGVTEEQIDPQALEMIEFALAKMADDLPAVGALQRFTEFVEMDDELFRTGLRMLVAGLKERYPALRAAASGGPRTQVREVTA